MVGPPAMVGRRPAKIPPAGTLGAPIPGPWVQAGGILAGRRPTMAGGPTIHHILYCILYYWVYSWTHYLSRNGSQKVLKPKIQIVEIEATYVMSTAAFFFYYFFPGFCKNHVFRKNVQKSVHR